MPFFNSGKIRLYFEERGAGVPLIFLHGFSLDRRIWQGQTDYFAEKYRVIVCDARGHGKSDAPETDYAREDRVTDLLNLAEHLSLPQFHLTGHSMGGGDALSFAIDYQDRLLSLTLNAAVAAGWRPSKRFRDYTDVARGKGIGEARRQWIDSVLSNYDKKNAKLRKRLETIMLDFSGSPWLDPMKGKYPKRDDLGLAGRLKVPTMIIVGRRDIFFRPLAEQLHQIIPGSQLEIMPEAGHMVNLESPAGFNSILEKFLAEAGGQNFPSGTQDA